VRQVAVYDVETNLMAASDGRLFGVQILGSGTGATILRIDPNGSIARHSLSDALATYYARLIASGASVYVGTSVIERFTNAPDELLRIDAATLAVIARRTLPGGVVGLVADATNLWVALPDRVLRLDPSSLAIRASVVIPGASPPPVGSVGVTALALGPGELLATVGDARQRTLYRFEPAALAILGQTSLANPEQVTGVVGGSESAWLTGVDWVERIDPSGRLGARIATHGLQAAVAQGHGLLALVDEGFTSEALLQVNAGGAVVGRTAVGDAGARIALDGSEVWLLHDLGITHWTLLTPQS